MPYFYSCFNDIAFEEMLKQTSLDEVIELLGDRIE
jgi:hypothetical protein